jgi:hypothetical protein
LGDSNEQIYISPTEASATGTADPLLNALDAFLDSSGSEVDIKQMYAAMDEISQRNAELRIPILNCTVEFECPKTWADLARTEQPNVRHCGTCEKDVTHCTTQEQLDELAKQGACVAFRSSKTTQHVGSVRSSGRKVSKAELRAFIDSL